MIPAIGLLIAAYAICRLAQVYVEHGVSAERDKTIQLISLLGIIAIVICSGIVLVNNATIVDTLKIIDPSRPKQ